MSGAAQQSVRAFAPATVANLGLGFDILGLSVRGRGDTVTATRSKAPGVRIKAIHGATGLPTDPAKNTAGVAAIQTLARAGAADFGVDLTIEKGLPTGSGLGSSAASAAAGAFAVNTLLGSPLRTTELIDPCADAEALVSGRHADNVAPALLGGLVLIRQMDPLDVVRLPTPPGLSIVVTTPVFELPTKLARQALPANVSLQQLVKHTANLAALISSCHTGDIALLSRCVADEIVAPARAELIPGAPDVLSRAHAAGALGCSISGAGPSVFALCRSARSADAVAAAMTDAFSDAGLTSSTLISPMNCPGARLL